MLRGEALDLVQGEQHLEVHGLLAPQGAVVVEHRDALGRGNVVLAALVRHGADEGEDGRARGTVLPRRQGIGGLGQQGQDQEQAEPPAQQVTGG
ncbi:hypothetical protein D9M69_710000 [compost metagenome]